MTASMEFYVENTDGSSNGDFSMTSEPRIVSFGINWDEIECSSDDDQMFLDVEMPTANSTPVVAPKPTAERFSAVSDEKEIEDRMKDRVPKQTQNNNNWAARAWETWAAWRNKQPATARDYFGPIPLDVKDCVTHEKLGYWLARFVLEVRKQDGKDYPFRSLYNLCAAIQRYLREKESMCDIHILDQKNAHFRKFVGALDSKMMELARKGIGTETNSADPITKQDEEYLWERNVINTNTAQGLSFGIYFYNSKLFGLRAMDEHVEMERSQFSIVRREDGVEGVKFSGRICKNQRGGIKMMKSKQEFKSIVHWSEPGHPRDIVQLYKKYLSLIPRKGRMYRKPSASKKAKRITFSSQHVGVNKLKTYMRLMFAEAEIDTTDRKISNHSVKASLCTNMWQDGFDDQQISSRSGHRSDALWKYKRMGKEMEDRISSALQPPRPLHDDSKINVDAEPIPKFQGHAKRYEELVFESMPNLSHTNSESTSVARALWPRKDSRITSLRDDQNVKVSQKRSSTTSRVKCSSKSAIARQPSSTITRPQEDFQKCTASRPQMSHTIRPSQSTPIMTGTRLVQIDTSRNTESSYHHGISSGQDFAALFEGLKRVGGGEVTINADNTINIKVTK